MVPLRVLARKRHPLGARRGSPRDGDAGGGALIHMPLLALVLACSHPEDTSPNGGPTDGAPPDTESAATGATGDTAASATGETGLPTPAECLNLPTGTPPVPYTVIDIATTEDFDFDALGYVVYSDWVNFVVADVNANTQILAPGILDTRGIQVLENGDIVAAYITEGALGYTNRLTGAGYALVTGLSGPNAVDVGDGNEIFVSETGGGPKVRSWDLDTLTPTNIADGFQYPNGIALNDAQDVLYVTDSTAGVYRVPKNEDGTWGPKELLFDPPGAWESYDGIEVDICGNVYIVNFYDGKLFRFNPDTRERALLVDLEDPGEFLYNAIRWGSDRGGWRRDVLYVTDRNKIFVVEVGVRGRRQAVDAMP